MLSVYHSFQISIFLVLSKNIPYKFHDYCGLNNPRDKNSEMAVFVQERYVSVNWTLEIFGTHQKKKPLTYVVCNSRNTFIFSITLKSFKKRCIDRINKLFSTSKNHRCLGTPPPPTYIHPTFPSYFCAMNQNDENSTRI